MAEVRCQMCGKLNPPDSEFCQFCHAKLVPISFDTPTSDNDIDEEILSELDGNDLIEAESEESNNDWMNSFRQEVPVSDSDEELEGNRDNELGETEAEAELDLDSRINAQTDEQSTLSELKENSQTLPKEDGKPESDDSSGDDKSHLQGVISPQIESQDEINDVMEVMPPSEEKIKNDTFGFLSELNIDEDFPDSLREEQSGEFDNLSGITDFGDEQNIKGDEELSEELSETIDELGDLNAIKSPSMEEQPIKFKEGGKDKDELVSDDYEEVLPDWLTEALSESEGEIPENDQPDSVDSDEVLDIEQVQIPNWLKAQSSIAMTEFAKDELRHQELTHEGAGPLSGIDGVLSAEPDLSVISEPVTHTAKLKVTETQRAQSEVLERMIGQEGKAKPLPPRPVKTTHFILRLVIAIAILLSVLWAVFSGGIKTGLTNFNVGVNETRNTIEGLPLGATVLIAFDYEPSLSDEMDTITAPVLDHLMARGINLLIVSTVPTGGMQGEKLIQNLNQQFGYDYRSGISYANMGFIPGGSAGLQSFGNSPWRALPLTLDGIAIAELPFMMNINQISDFSMVIVATDKPDTGKTWLEQVKPNLGNTPLVLLLSSQAAPLLQPYFATHASRNQSVIIGVSGGAEYENIYQRLNQANRYWGALNIGILVAGLMITFGAIYSIGFGLFSKSSSKTEGEK